MFEILESEQRYIKIYRLFKLETITIFFRKFYRCIHIILGVLKTYRQMMCFNIIINNVISCVLTIELLITITVSKYIILLK